MVIDAFNQHFLALCYTVSAYGIDGEMICLLSIVHLDGRSSLSIYPEYRIFIYHFLFISYFQMLEDLGSLMCQKNMPGVILKRLMIFVAEDTLSQKSQALFVFTSLDLKIVRSQAANGDTRFHLIVFS